jgi:hypothetical protein
MTEDNLKPIEEMEEETRDMEEESSEDGAQEEEYVLPNDDTVPEKFRGKTPNDVVQSYVELEKMITKKAQEIAQGMINNNGQNITPEQKKDVKDIIEDVDLTKVDFTKMKPEDFARWMFGEMDKRVEARARHIVTQTSTVQQSVQQEVVDAQAKHPHLKDNGEYRETVIAFIENASARGETLSLEDACQKVDKLMGVTATPPEKKEEPKPNPVKRAGVEKTKPGDGASNLNDEDRVKQGMLSAGGGKSPMGGLGI